MTAPMHTTAPFVSVIIPVYDDLERLANCLENLAAQSYPKDRYEVVVVDNGSAQSPKDITDKFDFCVLTDELTPGSYAARNTGLEIAKGEALAFTDADCKPQPGWIEMGVKTLQQAGTNSLVGGKIKVFFADPSRPTLAEQFEDTFAFHQERYIAEFNYAATANLFAWRGAFEDVGAFNAALKSGGDREWCVRAHEKGYQLVYGGDAVVCHPARRTLGTLLAKHARVASGEFYTRGWDHASLGEVIRDVRSRRKQSRQQGASRGWQGRPSGGTVQRLKIVLLSKAITVVKITEKILLWFGKRPRR